MSAESRPSASTRGGSSAASPNSNSSSNSNPNGSIDIRASSMMMRETSIASTIRRDSSMLDPNSRHSSQADLGGIRKTKEMKVVVLGESNVGKTSIVQQFIYGHFQRTQSTIGASFVTKVVDVDVSSEVKLNIWDTAGQEKYRSLATLYYRGVESALMIYDITNRHSFEQIRDYWIDQVISNCDLPFKDDLKLVVVGNKIDLESERVVSTEEGKELASKYNTLFLEVCAKDGPSVNEIFYTLIKSIPDDNYVPYDTSLLNTAFNARVALDTKSRRRRSPGCCSASSSSSSSASINSGNGGRYANRSSSNSNSNRSDSHNSSIDSSN